MLEKSVVEKCWRRVVWKALERSVVERSLVEKCYGEVLW